MSISYVNWSVNASTLHPTASTEEIEPTQFLSMGNHARQQGVAEVDELLPA